MDVEKMDGWMDFKKWMDGWGWMDRTKQRDGQKKIDIGWLDGQ